MKNIGTGTLKAKAGTAIIEPYEKYGDKDGAIWIPEICKYVSGRSGRVIDYTPWTTEGNSLVWIRGRQRAIPAYRQNSAYEGMIGKHVVFSQGVKLNYKGKDYAIVRLEHILLISDARLGDTENQENGLSPRCQWCKSSSGEGNVLLDGSGYCPRCNLNAKGMIRDTEVKVDDDEVYELGGRKTKDDIKRAMGIADKEQIISYKGQKKRTRNRTVSA